MTTDRHCDKFNSLLLDLVYGELSAEEASIQRAHAAGCERCAAELAGLEDQRSLFLLSADTEPPANLDAPLLEQAARQATSWNAGPKAINSQTSKTLLDRAQEIFDRLVGVVLHPAFVSTVVVLVITVVAVFVQRQGTPFRTGPVTEEPGSPSAAEPPASAAAPTAKAETGLAREPKEATEPTPEVAKTPTITPKKELAPHIQSASGADGTTASRRRSKAAPKKKAAKAGDRGELDALLGSGQAEFKKSVRGPDTTSKSARGAGADDTFAPSPAPKPAPQPSRTRPAAAEKSTAESLSLDEDAGDPLSEGLSAFGRGNCTAAEPLLIQAAASKRHSAGHRAQAKFALGECARRRGRCSSALGHYDELLRLYPQATQVPEALYNGAICHQRLGQDSRAIEKLHRLRQFPKWRTRADALLQGLE